MGAATTLAALLLSASPVSGLKLAAPALSTVSVEQKLARFLSEHLAQQLKLAGVDVITQSEMESLLGMERQKQLLGCSDATGSCVAELANALGTDGLLLGDVAKVGDVFHLNLKIIASLDGKTIAAVSDEASTEEALVQAVTRAAKTLAGQASAALGRTLTPRFARQTDLRPLSFGLLGLGALVTGIGVALWVTAHGTWRTLASGSVATDAEGRKLKSDGELMQTLGIVGVSAGVVIILAGAGTLLFGPRPVSAIVAPVPGGAAAVVSGELPW